MPALSVQNSQIEETLRSSFASGGQEQNLASLLISQSRAVLLKNITFKEASNQTCAHDHLVKSKYVVTKMTEQLEKKKPVVVLNGEHKKSLDGEGLPQAKVMLYDPNRLTTQWKQITRVGTGLNNLGNTCFCNATLQCLTFTPALYYFLLGREHSQNCGIHGFCMICTLEDHIRNVTNRYGQSINPWSVVKNFKAISKSFVLGRQEDAHEFLRYVIDNMTKASLWGKPKLDSFSKNTTAISQIFGGYLRSQVRCKNCEHKSNTYDPFLDIALDIKEANNVTRALEHFTKGESLFGDNAYLCEKCKRKVGAVKRFSIHKVPNVLTLQLKRFDAIRLSKINKDVNFPETLNIRPFMSIKQGDPVRFKLYGVLVHQGFSTSSGHYFSFVKTPSGQWMKMDDSRVFKVGLEQVLRQSAYILFYNRSTEYAKKTCQNSITGPQAMHLQNTGIKQNKLVNGPTGKPVNELGTPIIRKLVPTASATISRPTSAAASKPSIQTTAIKPNGNVLQSSPLQKVNQQQQQHGPQYSKIASLAGRDKVSFGIKTKNELKDPINKPPTSLQQESPSKENQLNNSVPLVIKIKDGKVVSNTASPPENVKKIQDLVRLKSDNNKVPEAKRRLVPYVDDNGSSSDSDIEVSTINKKVTQIKVSGIEPINGNKPGAVNGHNKQNGVKNQNGSQAAAKKSKTSDTFEPILDEKLKTTTEVPGAYAPLDREKISGFKTPTQQLRNGDHGHLTVKLSPEPSKVNSTTKWTVFEPEQKSPSLASSSSSVNSTSEWKIQNSNKKDQNGEEGFSADASFKPIDGVTEIAGWTVTINRDSPQIEETSIKENCSIQKNGGANIEKSSVIGKTDNSILHLKDKLPTVVTKHHSSHLSQCKVNGNSNNSSTFKHTSANQSIASDTGKVHHTSESSLSSSFNAHDSLLNTSETQPLLENGSHKKHKKKKKKRKHESVDEKMKVYDYNSDNEDHHTSEKKKKKKKKKRKHDEDDDDKTPLLSSPSSCKKPHLETGNGNSNQSSTTSEEMQWVEVTKKTIENKQKPVPVQQWDQSFKKTNGQGHQQHNYNHSHDQHKTNGNSNGFHRNGDTNGGSSKGWDGMRNKTDILKELHKESLQGYGSSVSAWDGGKSSIDQEVIRERRKDKKRNWDDDYEDELNTGKVKKIKQHNEEAFGGPNYFQKQQSWMMENKNKARNLFDQFPPHNNRGNGSNQHNIGNQRHNNNYNGNKHHSFHGNGNNNHHRSTPQQGYNNHYHNKGNHHNYSRPQQNHGSNHRKFYR